MEVLSPYMHACKPSINICTFQAMMYLFSAISEHKKHTLVIFLIRTLCWVAFEAGTDSIYGSLLKGA